MSDSECSVLKSDVIKSFDCILYSKISRNKTRLGCLNIDSEMPKCEVRSVVYRGSYMSAHVLLYLLNKLGKRDKMRGLPSNLSLFSQPV